jgi:hypothetical protein
VKNSSGPWLLLHMHKCCRDLLPNSYDLDYINGLVAVERATQQQQQQPSQQQQSPVATGVAGGELEQLLTNAKQQEQGLRMRALRLRFIDDSKLRANEAGCAKGTEEEAAAPGSGQSSPSTSSTSSRPQEPQHEATLLQAAAAAAVQASTSGPQANPSLQQSQQQILSSNQAQGPKRRRLRSSGRTPVRSIQQLMQELQLPEAR